MKVDESVKDDHPSYEQVLVEVKLLFRETSKTI